MKIFFCILQILVLAAQAVMAQPTNLMGKPVQAPGIENFFQLSDRVYSGSAPDGDKAFAALKAMGFKTIISVDGSKPDVGSAKKYGLRYVHLPIGYDGVPTNQAVRLVKAAETMPQPIFVHCHHGMHRGPAGAAVICEGMEHWTPEQAVNWLKQAGTATNYTGLYKSVAEFHPPSDAELKKISSHFPEVAKTPPLVDTMVAIDERFDNLKMAKKAGYQTPTGHPDIAPAHEALQLDELFKELLRKPEIQKRSEDFVAKMMEAEKAADEFHQMLVNGDKTKLDAVFDRTMHSCAACHKLYRNQKNP